jgi:Cdc6-like AAA superfamily ATPase
LYESCAHEYVERNPELIHDSADAFVERMVNLHRGLVLKVLVEVVQARPRCSPAELEFARELFDHAWGKRLNDQQVKEALLQYTETTHLRWESLLYPFERLSTFRARAAELVALTQQLAERVAALNPHVDARTRRQLRWITAELERFTCPVALAGTEPRSDSPAAGRSAVQQQDDFEITPQALPRPGQGVRVVTRASEEELAEVLEELDGLIGLDTIKCEVRELVNFLKIQEERKKYDLPQTPMTLHAVFTGDPGTGKTTVARLVGRILGAMGILAKGHLIETDRSGLVAEYAGQTGPKTNKRIDEALDGVLFIDEAYSLVAEKGDDPYGTEALQTLLKRMEDNRDRLVVILAGYPRPMTALLRTNPGLTSRFSRTFAFPDYTAAELGRIFQRLCERDRYQLPGRTRAKLLLGFRHLLGQRDEHFGNGRLVRTVFERSVRRLANRLAGIKPLTRELLTTLQAEDLVLDEVPAALWGQLDSDTLRFALSCPGCQQSSRLSQKYLGRKVQCRRCGHEFDADWGEAVEG